MYGQRQQHQQQLEAASYPLMQVAEICDCLSALNIPVQQEDIMKPHAASAQHIYSSLVAEIMGAPMDMIEQPKGALMGMMEYREVYSDALSFTLFFRHARTLAETCGIRNFTISDLTRPDGGRLRHHLSGIMNFAKYRDEKSALQQQLQEQNRRASERMSKLQKQLEEVEHNISIITEKNAADKPRTEEARQRNERLRDELLELRNSQMRLSHDVEELKKDRVGLNETAAGQTNTLNQLDVNINSARSRLVQSPERIKKHISEMSYNVSTEKATLANNQRKGRDFTNRLEIIGQLETDIKGLIDLSKGIEQQRAKVEDAKRALLALRAKLENKDIDSKTLITRTDQLQRQIQNALDRHARSEANVQETREKHRNRMEELSAEYKSLSTKRTIVSKEREKLEAEQRELEGEMEAFVKTHEEELNSLLEEYWILRGQAEDYFGTMYRTLGLDKYQ